MSYCRQVTSSLVRPAIVPAILIFSLFSCRVPVNFQQGKPFVYKTTIKVEGNIKAMKNRICSKDWKIKWMTVCRQKRLPLLLPLAAFIYKKLPNPPVFDSANVGRSIVFMNALLTSNGYYAPQIRDTVIYKIHKYKDDSLKEQRVTIRFTVKPGKQMVFDSVGFSLTTPEFQQIAMDSRKQSLIKVGQPYSRQLLSNEINRLVDSFRNNGYYRFSKEDLYVEHDTVFAALIDPSLDPH